MIPPEKFFFMTCPFFPKRWLVVFLEIRFSRLTTADMFLEFFTPIIFKPRP